MEKQGKIEITGLDNDEDFQVMDDVFSTEKDEKIPLVLEEETLCGFKSNRQTFVLIKTSSSRRIYSSYSYVFRRSLEDVFKFS